MTAYGKCSICGADSVLKGSDGMCAHCLQESIAKMFEDTVVEAAQESRDEAEILRAQLKVATDTLRWVSDKGIWGDSVSAVCYEIDKAFKQMEDIRNATSNDTAAPMGSENTGGR